VTDASKHLHFVDPAKGGGDMTLSKSTVVTDGDNIVRFANELETIKDEVWANVLERDCIARIDPETGKVVGLKCSWPIA
jgi:glutamine cyclotransferase